MTLNKNSLKNYAAAARNEYEGLLEAFVNIPSVSADPRHAPDIEAVSELACEALKKSGAEARVYRLKGANPLIHGIFHSGKGRPTVTVYNHMDVQPADRDLEGWKTEPFTFLKRGDTYHGRGATDDKGPALAALFGARAALDSGVPVNIHFLWECEEEIGSTNFDRYLSQQRKRFATDSVVVSDTMWLSRHRPTITSGLRGQQSFRFTLETGLSDQHSGDVGGAARNPIAELMELMVQIHDAKTGLVKIPGFYKDVVVPTAKEIEEFRNSGFSLRGFLKAYGYRTLRTMDAVEVMKRIWALPTFEIHGVAGGYQGPGIKGIVPPRAEVKASCRLVPDQDPERIAELIRKFVRKHNPDVRVESGSGSQPYRAETSGPLADAVRHAMKFAFNRDPAFVREGGSIGAVIQMQQILQCPVQFLGLSLPEHGYHAPNEFFDWQQASGGMVAFAAYFEELSMLRKTR